MKKRLIMLTACVMVVLMVVAQVQISIDANQRGPKISPTHYGIFFEDINHAADGGIYAELIRNRSFEDGPEYGKPATTEAWSTYASPGSTIDMRLIQPSKKVKLLNAAQGNALELTVSATAQTPVCLVNEGFWGINAVQGRNYKLSFWAKGSYKGTVKATLCSKDGSAVYAETVVSASPASTVISASPADISAKQWRKYTATLTATGNDPQAQFALVFDGKGVLDLDVVSLFPPTFKNRENGLRPDLAQMLYEMHPKFMRFPGGCFVEGQISPDNAFRWERTIGPIEERPGHWNVNWGYRTTDGIGFHEYLQMAEDLGAKPLYVVNVGLWHGGMTPYNDIQPWIDECLAALEYANGDVTTKYGALRAKNGHPAPFNIEYLEIGNENNQPDPAAQSDHYYERYEQFRQAILAKYPNMQLIGNVVAWGDDNPQWGSQLPVELLDEHYYRNPAWFAEAFRKYDSYDRRGPKIYVGEYAVTSGFGNLGNMNAALGEAVYMMGMENNSDIVPLNSYAPIFVNENDAKWRPDMIRFNSSRVMGTPSYYVQQLMPRHLGTQVVRVEQQDSPLTTHDSPLTTKPVVTPQESRIGFATWATQASFTHPDPLPKTGQPEFITGQWQKNADGSISQTSMQEQCVAVCRAKVGDHYTARFRARKDGGNEGFMVVFNYIDKDHYDWINFGGWNNTQHGIEHISGGGKAQIATKPGKVEAGRWYDITLQVAGDSVKCWLDQDLVFDTVLKGDVKPGVFSSATIDDNDGTLIVKVVNTGSEAVTARLDISNFKVGSAQLIRLRANDGMDENTLEQPTNIYPTTHELSPKDNLVEFEVAPYSLNIVRVRSGIQYAMSNVAGTTEHPLVHDPVMAYEDGTYHLFFTGDGINHLTSTDRKTWNVIPAPVMSVMPQWTHDSVPGFKHTVWAPDIIRWHNRWWLAYSCSTFGKNGSTIGLLSTPSLRRPVWYDEGCIVISREGRDNWNAIDPNFVIDDNDQPWLVWGSFWDGIQLAPLDTTMHLKTPGKTIARRYDPAYKNPKPNPTSQYAGTNAIEAPFIMKHDGWYYLFVSWDYCCQGNKSDYQVAVGRSRQVAGPYLDREGKDMLQGGGTIVFQGDKKEYEAAGHCAAYHINGEDIFLCHGYSIAHDGAPVLIQRSLRWTPDGWPEIEK